MGKLAKFPDAPERERVRPEEISRETNYVRVTSTQRRGFVEFQFSVGDPNLYLEMTLPPKAFAEFCTEHQVIHLTAAQAAEVDRTELKWRDGVVEDNLEHEDD